MLPFPRALRALLYASVLALAASSCAPEEEDAPTAKLVLTVTTPTTVERRAYLDGAAEEAEVRITATDAEGRPGQGLVTVTAAAGTLNGARPHLLVELNNGEAVLRFTCVTATDTACEAGLVRVRALWLDRSAGGAVYVGNAGKELLLGAGYEAPLVDATNDPQFVATIPNANVWGRASVTGFGTAGLALPSTTRSAAILSDGRILYVAEGKLYALTEDPLEPVEGGGVRLPTNPQANDQELQTACTASGNQAHTVRAVMGGSYAYECTNNLTWHSSDGKKLYTGQGLITANASFALLHSTSGSELSKLSLTGTTAGTLTPVLPPTGYVGWVGGVARMGGGRALSVARTATGGRALVSVSTRGIVGVYPAAPSTRTKIISQGLDANGVLYEVGEYEGEARVLRYRTGASAPEVVATSAGVPDLDLAASPPVASVDPANVVLYIFGP